MSDRSVTPEPRPLSYWLDAESSGSASEPTVLRRMAYRWSLRQTRIINLWGSILLVAAAPLFLPSTDVVPGILGVLAGLFAVYAIACTVYHRYRPLPSLKGWQPNVWVRTTRGGVLAAVTSTAMPVLVVLLQRWSGGFAPDPWFFSFVVLCWITVSMQIVLQGWLYENSRRLFRQRIEKDDRIRTALEEMSMNPPTSTRTPAAFGPL